MGTTDLRELALISECEISNFDGCIAAVDAQNWITEYSMGVRGGMKEESYTSPDGKPLDHLIGSLNGVRKLVRNDITPVFAFDGIEMSELKTRNQPVDPNASFQHHTDFYRDTIRKLFSLLDFPYVDGSVDGEAEAAALVQKGLADFVLTNDYDALLFGAPVTIRKFTGHNSEELMNLSATLDIHDISQKELIDISILVGNDYFDGVPSIGVQTAVEGVKEYDSIDELSREHGFVLPNGLEELRAYFLDAPTAGLHVTEFRQAEPDLDTLEKFLDAVGLSSKLVDSQISNLKRAFTNRDKIS